MADSIRHSAIFRRLESENPAVDVWADSDAEDDGWSYFWIVSEFAPGSIRELAYLRRRDNELEKRGYDQAGEVVWTRTR